MTNNEIKLLKSLSQKKYRYKHKKFLVEGLRIIKESISLNHEPLQLWTTKEFLNSHPQFYNNISIFNYEIISENYFRKILNTENPQHVMAVFSIPEHFEKIKNSNENILLLDGISDPGNMGSLLRSAAWYGIRTVVCSNLCVDAYNPKVVRAGMGAHFYLNIVFNVDLVRVIKQIKYQKFNIMAATLDGVSYKSKKSYSSPWGLVLGNEAHGINNDISDLVDEKISIPSKGSIESLNVAIAGSILLDRIVHK